MLDSVVQKGRTSLLPSGLGGHDADPSFLSKILFPPTAILGGCYERVAVTHDSTLQPGTVWCVYTTESGANAPPRQ